MPEKIGLAISGGGFRGSIIGPHKALWRRNKIPDKIQGVSVGALNAAKLAESGIEALEENWRIIGAGHPSAIFNKLDIITRFNSNAPFSDAGLKRLIGKLDPVKIINSPIELEVVVNNETKRRMQVFSSRDLIFQVDKENPKNPNRGPHLLLDAIKASASLPGFFPPVNILGEWFSDGYCFHLERFADFDTLFVVLHDDPEPRIFPESHWFRRIFAGPQRVLSDHEEGKIHDFLRDHPDKFTEFKFSSKLGLVDRILTFLSKGVDKLQGKGRLVLFSPDFSIPTLELASFQRGDIEKAIDMSFLQAEKLLDEIYPPTPTV
ncbi:MAG: patatin-like phospholipase family protein [bacterium]|nr:patatin-like phospholipase family protein [bacterium]